MGILEGVRILDLTQILAGPLCTMFLGDLGADVIKIERYPDGDDVRRMIPVIQGESGPFLMVNRNKRSVVLDIKSNEGHDIFLELARTADIIVENFRPGVTKQLGIDYDTLKVRNPRLIYCSISAFGQNGPYSQQGGFDIATQAMTGIMSVTGERETPPVKVGIAITDAAAGLTAVYAILAAIIARSHSGLGQYVETSLFDAGLALCVWEAAWYFYAGEVPGPLGSAHRLSAPYQAVRTKDRYIIVAAANQKTWEKFCLAVGKADWLSDSRFLTNSDRMSNKSALIDLIEEHLVTANSDHWLKILQDFGVPCAPILDFGQSLTDLHTLSRNMVLTMNHPALGVIRSLGNPVKFSDYTTALNHHPPVLGEHTNEVLAEMGYDRDAVRLLKEKGVVG
ncbi:MAG: CoA transferase [Peptococcaceae bacterium]|nr:CoA transferase [Peptococcaceae bacterium]